MDLMPVASFLAGSLLTILVPTLLLIAITVWFHYEVVRRGPERRGHSRPPESTQDRAAGDRPRSESPPSGG